MTKLQINLLKFSIFIRGIRKLTPVTALRGEDIIYGDFVKVCSDTGDIRVCINRVSILTVDYVRRATEKGLENCQR